jgi:aspartyl-tRNA(Asn)/glutamyl-tRNA(Gln) amidotransferase subunit A
LETPSSLREIREALLREDYSLTDLVKHYQSKIAERSHLAAFREVFTDDSLERASEVQSKIKAGTAGKLAGMVLAIKDNICYRDHEVGAASKILEGFISPYHATIVERLLAEDVIIIGRTSCDEFAMGSSNENSAYGPVLNPLDEALVPGGSSGGSAAAVAAGMCLASLGSDTGGSIRQPASFCGLVGLKPTYGRVSRYGLLAYASSMDQIGPFASKSEDAALLLEVMAGKDSKDNTSSNHRVDEYSEEGKARTYELAYYKEIVEHPGLDPQLKADFLAQLEILRSQGHKVEELSFPYLNDLVPTYNVLSNAEASSNLSRYDGIRYGYRSENAGDIDTTYTKSRSEGFGPEVKRRIMLGTFVLSSGYYDAYYSKAQKVRRLIRDATINALSDCDFILSPTTPHSAFKIGDIQDPVQMYLEDIFTVQANLAGVPSVSIPKFKSASGMPIGLQITAGPFEEKKMLQFARSLED